MKKQGGEQETEQSRAAAAIEEARQLNETIAKTLNAILDDVKTGEFKDLDLLPRQMTRLQNVVADVRKKEEAFNDQFGERGAEGEIDFDRLRYEIGCRLNRIRQCCREA